MLEPLRGRGDDPAAAGGAESLNVAAAAAIACEWISSRAMREAQRRCLSGSRRSGPRPRPRSRRPAGTAELEELRVRYLGRKAELTGDPARDRRAAAGGTGQGRRRRQPAPRRRSRSCSSARAAELDASELEARLAEDRVDVTLPGAPPRPVGHLHLITRTTRQIEDVMVGLGYRVMEGPEIEHDYYNFTALNHPPGHPARMLQDTFYVQSDPEVLLRTHTSPVQPRSMETQPPPIFIDRPGQGLPARLRRHPQPDVPPGRGPGDRRGHHPRRPAGDAARRCCGRSSAPAARRGCGRTSSPSPSPASSSTSPASSATAPATLAGGERCNLCKGIGWIEVGGAGMVDPNVLGFVESNGYDPERVQGFAFGMGVERIAMLRHGVPDLRRFFDNDVRVLGQFS